MLARFVGLAGGGQSCGTFAVFVGTALSISALPVIARILVDLNLLRQQIGVIILSAATIDDLIGWSLFAVILGTMGKGNGAPLAGHVANPGDSVCRGRTHSRTVIHRGSDASTASVVVVAGRIYRYERSVDIGSRCHF